MRTLSENFEGFSEILKEQSGKKSYLGAFTHPIAIIQKYENIRILRKIVCPRTIQWLSVHVFSNFAIEYLRENDKVL